MAAEGDEQAAAELMSLPDAPDIDLRWLWLWQAWMALQSARPWIPVGMGEPLQGQVPWAAIEHYADRVGCGVGERLLLHGVVEKLDREWRRITVEQRRAREKQ